MSMLIAMSVSSTELTSPYSYISINDLVVTNLSSPILVTIPLNKALDRSNPNNTLGCGFIDPVDIIFSQTGYGVNFITDSLVTCQITHLTQIGVEQYEQDLKTKTYTSTDTVITAKNNQKEDSAVVQINMWASWAVYACFSLGGLLLVGLLYMRRRDAKDEQHLDIIRKNKKKIYINLFLEPIEDIKRQGGPAALTNLKQTKKTEEYQSVNQNANDVAVQKPDKMPAGNDTFFGNMNNKAEPEKPTPAGNDLFDAPQIAIADDADTKSLGSKSSKKKKKKKKKAAVDDDLFFEGGSSESSQEFEGGDEDDFFAVADAEESARLSSKKKKKKKSSLNKGATAVEASSLPQILPSIGRPSRGQTVAVVEEINIDEMEEDSKSNKRSTRSKSRGKSQNPKSAALATPNAGKNGMN